MSDKTLETIEELLHVIEHIKANSVSKKQFEALRYKIVELDVKLRTIADTLEEINRPQSETEK